jgi:hypothetical protein
MATDTRIPAWTRPVYAEGGFARPTNIGGELPLWSGKGEPPAIGSVVSTRAGNKLLDVTITGYEVIDGYLMALGYRTHDPKVKGNLAGAEINWPA